MEYFGRVLALDPDNHHAHNNLAVLYFEQKEYNRALLSLQRALKVEPSFDPAVRNMEQVQKMLSNRGEGANEASREYADRKPVSTGSGGESDG